MPDAVVPIDRRPAAAVHADVLVVGGGAAGLAAAVTAAEQGLSTVLVERYGFCGGGAVAGMSGTICGLYLATDRSAPPEQIVHGFVDVFIGAMEERQGLTAPVRYGKTFTRVHDPLVWREVADDLLDAAGVHVLYHAYVTSVLLDGDRVAGVEAHTKQGRVRVEAAVTVDASGDADVVAMAGFPTFSGRDGAVQNPTMIFRLQGVDVDRFLAAHGPDSIVDGDVSSLIAELHAAGDYKLPRSKVFLFPSPRPGELLCNATRITGRDGRELNTLRIDDFTEAEVLGRRQVREYERFFRTHLQGCERGFVNDTGVQVGVRQTRQAAGVTTLQNADVLECRKTPDGVARSPWPIEVHSGERPQLHWLLDDYYEVPFGCFLPAQGESLLVAGRCLSAEHEAMASARVTAQCFSYGHAVGHAAAIAVRDGINPRDIDAVAVRTAVNKDSADLD